jgi:serine/threonine protein kinase
MALSTPDIFKEKVVVGEGTFGKVYKAKIGDNFYALKKIKMEQQQNGFPITSVREIMVLNKLKNHPHIV